MNRYFEIYRVSSDIILIFSLKLYIKSNQILKCNWILKLNKNKNKINI